MEPIAIIGIGCRFPGADNTQSFWQLLENGTDAIKVVPSERWNIELLYDPEPGKPGKMSTCYGGFLKQIDQFDTEFFGISPRETERIDPHQRLILEVAWEALENASIVPVELAESKTGVFIGCGNYDYGLCLSKDLTSLNAHDGTGCTIGMAANRLSYLLNLRGPSLTMETACSSSLVAVHLACQSLRSQETDLCLVGGVSLMLSPEQTIIYSHARMMASDGRCKTFDASADGYVRGEGCGIIVLKRLSDAIRDKDNIQAIIRGSAVNQDGSTNGLTAPNGLSQQAVIRQALANASVAPTQISYIEAHGTGTALGDPIEFKALKAVLMPGRQPHQSCWIGSVKTNIGHLEAAAGIAGLIKVVLSLKNQKIPAHLHLKELNPYISLEETTFNIPTQSQVWTCNHQPRLAGVSSFGFGGTNAHVILEEAPVVIKETCYQKRPLHFLTLSAKNEQALKELAQRYANFLVSHSDISLKDVCLTANTKRTHFNYRLAIITESVEQLHQQLESFATENQSNFLVSGKLQSRKSPKISFLFTGQGSQYINMGRQLYETEPIFCEILNHCQEILRPYLDKPLLEIIYPNPENKIEDLNATNLLNNTAYTQPALFALEYALYQVWTSWGIEPNFVMGHSVGEYVAACVAGVFSLEDGLRLISHRGKLMQSLPQNGEMLAILASEQQIAEMIAPYKDKVSFAAINGPENIVISGERLAIKTICDKLNKQGIKNKALIVSHPFHSPLMEPILAKFQEVAKQITYSHPKIKIISNVTGQIVTDEIATPDYWCRHLRQPVQFAKSIQTLHTNKCQVFLELGPKPVLSGMGRQCLSSEQTWLPSLRLGTLDWQQILQSLAHLYVRGVSVKWLAFEEYYKTPPLELPTYPFQRQRYWLDRSSQEKLQPEETKIFQSPIIQWIDKADTQKILQNLKQAEEFSENKLEIMSELLSVLVKEHQKYKSTNSYQDWIYQLQWQIKKRIKQSSPSKKPKNWLIFADNKGMGKSLAQSLQDQNYILVYAGENYHQLDKNSWCINPYQISDFKQLFQEIIEPNNPPFETVVHLWSLDAAPLKQLTLADLEQRQRLGCASVLHLLQTLLKQTKSAFPRLWLVTQGAMSVESSDCVPNQASLWGLGRVIALEHPELWGGMLDLDPQANLAATKTLLAEIEDSQGEDQLAFRKGRRYVARLASHQVSSSQKPILRGDRTYIITGGLGALGIKIAQWMVEKGVRSLVLIGRRRASLEVEEILTILKQKGANVLIAQADVSQEAEMLNLLQQVKASLPLIGGIIHLAGILDDGILLQQNWQRFSRVMQAKIAGAWNLHTLTQDLPLDFFVCFSSVASLLGSPGQANYASANAFLDSLAYHRQAQGLPGLSLNWGQWAETGMAANLDKSHQARLTKKGLTPITLEAGLQILGQVLGQTQAQLVVLPIDWSALNTQESGYKTLPLLSGLLTKDQENSQELQPQPNLKFLQNLQEALNYEREEILISFLQREVAAVLGLELNKLPNTELGFFDMGMDSLMAVELKNRLEKNLSCSLPAILIFETPSIQSLAKYLLKKLIPQDQDISKSNNTNSKENQEILSTLEEISENKIEELFAEKLSKLKTLLENS